MKTKYAFAEPIVGLLILLVLVGGLTWFLREPPVEFIQGEVDATQVDLAVKIAGRVSSVWVKEGQSVHKGDHLLDLDIPEIRARLRQASAAEQAAGAQRDKAFARGPVGRKSWAAMNLWLQAKEAADLAEKNLSPHRKALHRRGGPGPAPRRGRSQVESIPRSRRRRPVPI